jgi:hypothetical protein
VADREVEDAFEHGDLRGSGGACVLRAGRAS